MNHRSCITGFVVDFVFVVVVVVVVLFVVAVVVVVVVVVVAPVVRRVEIGRLFHPHAMGKLCIMARVAIHVMLQHMPTPDESLYKYHGETR